MKRWLIIPLTAVALGAAAQGPSGKPASKSESDAMLAIHQCMAPGLPEDWTEAVMVVQLNRPGDQTGAVQYLVARGKSTVADERFIPCDVRTPAMALIEARKHQPASQRGWIGARVMILRDGKFNVKYEYPAK